MSGSGLPPGALEKLATVRVGLRTDLEIVRQMGAKDSVRYVLHDPLQFSNYMFDPHEYRVLTAIDERTTLGTAFERLVETDLLRDEDRGSFFEFVLLQHQRGLLRLPIADGHRAWQKAKRQREQDRAVAPLRRLLYWRIPVWSPDRCLVRAMPWVGWIFGKWGLAVWATLMVFAAWMAGDAFGSLLFEAPQLLEPDNLPLMWVSLIGLKAVHEFGHAFACRRLGGSVPEMGLAFILGAPCAYVDASAAWRFEKRRDRVGVSMAGMYAESFVAAIALLVWAGSDQGIVKAAAHNVVVLATAITVLFNVNPLMRFDGYYLLSDLIHEPNLRARSSKELARIGRKLLGLTTPPRSERWRLHWAYGIGSFGYKILLGFGIVRIVMFDWPLVGAGFAIAFGWMLLGQPVLHCVHWLWASEETERIRVRARGAAVAICTIVPLASAFLVPVGFAVEVPGIVVSKSGEQVLRAPYAAFVLGLPAQVGSRVAAGQIVAVLESTDLERRLCRALADRDAARAERLAAEAVDPSSAASAASRETVYQELVATLEQMLTDGHMRSPIDGVVTSTSDIRTGAYVEAGDKVVTIEGLEREVEAWIEARELDRSRISRFEVAELRYARGSAPIELGTIVGIDPTAADRESIPDLMTTRAGGPIRLQTIDGLEQADRAYVRLRIQPDEIPLAPSLGSAVRVRFRGRIQSLASWLALNARSLLQQWRLAEAR